MHLDGDVHLVKRGSAPDIHHASPAVPIRKHNHRGVHPAFGSQFAGVLEGKVGSGVAELSPAPLSSRDEATEPVGPSQSGIGLLDASLGQQQGPDGAGGHDVVIDLLWRDNIHRKAVLLSKLAEIFDVTGSAFAKPVVVANRDLLRADPIYQYLFDIGLRTQLRKVVRKRDDDEPVETKAFQQICPLSHGRQERNLLVVYHSPRVRIERDEGTWPVLRLSSFLKVFNNCSMAAMHTVKRSDGHNRSGIVTNGIPSNFALHGGIGSS